MCKKRKWNRLLQMAIQGGCVPMTALSKYKVNIHVSNIADNLWMRPLGPDKATHRIWMEATIKGVEYFWMQYFDDKRIKLQEVIKIGCRVFMRKEKNDSSKHRE